MSEHETEGFYEDMQDMRPAVRRARHSGNLVLTLSATQYCWVQNKQTGVIIPLVGPVGNVTIDNTVRLVDLDDDGTPSEVPEEEAIKSFIRADEDSYVILENPAKDQVHPSVGRNENSKPDLQLGTKVVIPGECSFALWPLQKAEVVRGHRLAKDQYVLCKVTKPSLDQDARFYDVTARAIKEALKMKEAVSEEVEAAEKEESFPIGTQFNITGQDVSFYVPPTGVEVVRSGSQYIRDAIVLKAMYFCGLYDEEGALHYVRGPKRVFPQPHERLFKKEGNTKFPAYNLIPEEGLHIRVIADTSKEHLAAKLPAGTELEKDNYVAGDELFITGVSAMFFPCDEIEVLDKVSPITCDSNMGVYVRNIHTGNIETKKGPTTFAPDPRKQEIVKRNIFSRTLELWRLDYDSHDPTFAPTIKVENGEAVMLTKGAEREVVVGPALCVMDYDQELEVLELSTGTPKSAECTKPVCFLRIAGNRNTDRIKAKTSDDCWVEVKVALRVSFEGDDQQAWFRSKNYIQLLVDHCRSLLQNVISHLSSSEFYLNSRDIIRDALLGKKGEGSERAGRRFDGPDEPNMRVYEVEIIEVNMDPDVLYRFTELQKARMNAEVEAQLRVLRQKEHLATLEADLEKAKANAQTALQKASTEAEKERALLKMKEETAQMQAELDEAKEVLKQRVAEAQAATEAKRIELQMEKAGQEAAAHLASLKSDIEYAEQEKAMVTVAAENMLNRAKADAEITRMEQQLKYDFKKLMEELRVASETKLTEAEAAAVATKLNAIAPKIVAALEYLASVQAADGFTKNLAPLAILGGTSVVDVVAQLLDALPLGDKAAPDVLRLKEMLKGQLSKTPDLEDDKD